MPCASERKERLLQGRGRAGFSCCIISAKKSQLKHQDAFPCLHRMGGPGLKQLTATGRWKNEGKLFLGSAFVRVCV